MSEDIAILAPDVGAVFVFNDDRYKTNGRYRVTGWLKEASPPKSDPNDLNWWIDQIVWESTQKVGPDKKKLVFCDRKSAEYVSGSGISGCIARITDIKVVGRIEWSEKDINDARRMAVRNIGNVVF